MKRAKIVKKTEIIEYLDGDPKTAEEKLLYTYRGGRTNKITEEETVVVLSGKNKREITAKFWEWVSKNYQYSSRDLYLEDL